MYRTNEIYLTMAPSREEIDEYAGDSTYYCGLEITRKSIHELVDAAQKYWREGDKADPHWASPRFAPIRDRESRGYHGNFPQVLFNLVLVLTSGGMGAAVYKLLSLWVKAKNGRKIHVKFPDGMTVDATQMNHEEFSAFIAVIYEVYDQHADQQLLKKYVSRKKLKEITAMNEGDLVRLISDAVRKKQREIQKRSESK